MSTIVPVPRGIIVRATARVTYIVPFRFIPITACHASSARWTTSARPPAPPAQCTSMSIARKRATVRSTICCTAGADATSTSSAIAS
jgi:hypothetical protein